MINAQHHQVSSRKLEITLGNENEEDEKEELNGANKEINGANKEINGANKEINGGSKDTNVVTKTENRALSDNVSDMILISI